MKIDNVNEILILVETNDGKAHQVLSTKEQKEIMLMMLSVSDMIPLSPELEPVELKFKKK